MDTLTTSFWVLAILGTTVFVLRLGMMFLGLGDHDYGDVSDADIGGDVDLDGDFDAVFADGGDNDQDQNRIWMNQGHDQGGTVGWFVDETTSRFPSVQDQSRDIEFADIDNDTDLDLYISNTAAIIPQSNRWWINSGTGTGFYVDETATRWVGLGGPGSSIATSQVLSSGGFRP